MAATNPSRTSSGSMREVLGDPSGDAAEHTVVAAPQDPGRPGRPGGGLGRRRGVVGG